MGLTCRISKKILQQVGLRLTWKLTKSQLTISWGGPQHGEFRKEILQTMQVGLGSQHGS